MSNNVVIFGSSNMGKSAYYAYKDSFQIKYFIDNNEKLWGKSFENIRIISPDELKQLNDVEIIVASMYYEDILLQLFSLGFDYAYIYDPRKSNNFDNNITKYDIKYAIHGDKNCQYAICEDLITQKSIVYSLGVGSNISFDLSLINKFGLDVYAFDPTPRSITWIRNQQLPMQYHFYDLGVSDFDGIEKFYLPEKDEYDSFSASIKFNERVIECKVNSLKTIAEELGHACIDILKMDIEGSEYKVIRDVLNSNIKVKQILVEFHHRFDDIGYVKTFEVINQLKSRGYKLFYVSQSGEEFSFLL